MHISKRDSFISAAPARETLTPGLSVYLDLVRFVAALLVFLQHARQYGLVTDLPWRANLASEAVAAFFVLSGYIIAATTNVDRGWRAFAITRCARIYSVVIPALLLGTLLKAGYSASHGWGELAAMITNDLALWKLATIFTFTGEIWTLKVQMPWDGAIWSLDYEVFYYVAFAIFMFAPARRRKIALAGLALLAGPKILVLAPCWAAGVFLARRPDLAFASRTRAWVALFGAPFIMWALSTAGLENFIKYKILWPTLPGFWHLQDAENFVTFYIDTVLVGAGFIAARQLDFAPSSLLMRCRRPIVWLAGFTFSLYLYHRPLQSLEQQYFQAAQHSQALSIALLAGILIAVALLGTVTEKRKEMWRRFFTWLLDGRRPARQALADAV